MKRSTSSRGQPEARGASIRGTSPVARGDAAPVTFAEPVGPAGDAVEREADRIANAVVRGDRWVRRAEWAAASAPSATIWRKCAECEEEEDEKIRRAPREGEATAPETEAAAPEAPAAALEAAPATDAPAAEASAEQAPAAEAPALLVDDDTEASRGQMRKSAFLAALRAEVCANVDGALSGTGRDSQGCPWIDHWLGYYEGRSAAQIETALTRYAPEAAGAAAVQDYIRIVSARVRTSAETFAKTGEVTGMPQDMPASPMPGGGVLGAVGGMFFKARPGGARESNPESVRQQLGNGQSLPAAVRTRMEPAFGASFARVRFHTDANAAQLSNRLNARAFTLGHDVVFGAGEYQPGTLVGDALIAHELAHVVQQGGSVASAPQTKSGPADNALEAEADISAVGAVAALWGGTKERVGALGQRTLPSLRSKLQLQRCGGAKPAAAPNLQTDKALRQSWETAFQEGVALLTESIARKGQERGCRFPGKKKLEEWRFDDTNWRRIVNQEEFNKFGAAFAPTKLPHVSVDELFNHLERWECDCALFTELTWLYAWRHTLPDKEFDQKFANLRLRPQNSVGLERERHNREDIELGLETGDFDALWSAAPIGTKVNWKNYSVHAESPWTFENAIKTRKGGTPDQDRYDAYPLGGDFTVGSNMTEEQVIRGLASSSADFPGKAFVITDQTLAALKADRAPAAFLKSLAGWKNKSFIGEEAFWNALAAPTQILEELTARDPRRHAAIRQKLLNTAHVAATEEEKQQYIKTNIRRLEFQIPK